MGPLLGAFVGTLVGGLVGQVSLLPALCVAQVFHKRELAEFCAKLGEFCEKLGEFRERKFSPKFF